MIVVKNFNLKGEEIIPKNIIIKNDIIYELVNKYYSKLKNENK